MGSRRQRSGLSGESGRHAGKEHRSVIFRFQADQPQNSVPESYYDIGNTTSYVSWRQLQRYIDLKFISMIAASNIFTFRFFSQPPNP
jgi:hypothetical protein